MGMTIIFAGTEEGQKLAGLMLRHEKPVHICVASEYGNRKMDPGMAEHTSMGRLSPREMEELFREKEAELVVDATSPFATAVQENIREVCEAQGLSYIRLRHPPAGDLAEKDRDCRVVHSVEAAAELLRTLQGGAMIALEPQDLQPFLEWPDLKKRLTLRVEPDREKIDACLAMGIEEKDVLALAGRGTEELEAALMRHAGASWLVTREAGGENGVQKLIRAVKRADAGLLLISPEVPGLSLQEAASKVCPEILDDLRELDVSAAAPRRITLLGVGMGSDSQLTWEGVCACREADVLIGPGRILAGLSTFEKPVHEVGKGEEIIAFLQSHPEYHKPVVAFSGDIGFYSGARKIMDSLREDQVEVLCGISSLAYFCGRLKMPWEEVLSVNLHNRGANLVSAVRRHEKVFCLGAGRNRLQDACRELTEYGLGKLPMWVGEDLGYPEERITRTTPERMQHTETGALVVALFENRLYENTLPGGLRADLPWWGQSMSGLSEDALAVILAKLQLNRNSLFFDAASGNGVAAILAADRMPEGLSVAVASDEAAVEAIRRNRKMAGISNMDILAEDVVSVLKELPFTHAFLKADSEEFPGTCELLRSMNPGIRIVAAGNQEDMEAVRQYLAGEPALPARCFELSVTEKTGGASQEAPAAPLCLYVIG